MNNYCLQSNNSCDRLDKCVGIDFDNIGEDYV